MYKARALTADEQTVLNLWSPHMRWYPFLVTRLKLQKNPYIMRTVKILIRVRTCADWTLIRVRRCAACSDIHVYTETGKYMHCASIHQNVIACACIHARMRACLCYRHLHTDRSAWEYTDVRMCVRAWIHACMTHMHLCVISIVIIIVITVFALNIGTPILFVISALKLKQDHFTTC